MAWLDQVSRHILRVSESGADVSTVSNVDEFVIRRATSRDIPVLARLRREFTLEDGPISSPREDFDAAFASIVSTGLGEGRWTVWVAEHEGEIVAHAFVGLIDKIPRPLPTSSRWLGYLTNMYTKPAFRSRGLGGRVLEAAKEWAKDDDVELLVVWPSDESVSFYRRHGFVGEREPLVWLNPSASE